MDYRQAVMRLEREGLVQPVYLLRGPEDHLKEEFVQEILKNLTKQGKSFSLERLNGQKITLEELMADIEQTTLFSGGRLIWVLDPPYFSASKRKEGPAIKNEKTSASRRSKNKQTGEKDLLSYLQRKNDIIIVFSVQDVDRRKKLVKAIEGAGMLINFPSLRGTALKKWLELQFLREKKKVEEGALDELMERLGDNLSLLKRESEKIATYMAEKKVVTPELVRYMVPESSEGNIFNLVEAIGQKNTEEALFHLHKMLRQNEPPLIIMAMISRQFRLLYQFLTLQEKGLTQREMPALLKVQPFVVKKLAGQAGRYNVHAIVTAIAYLQEIDLQVKTGRLEASEALEQLILNITIGL